MTALPFNPQRCMLSPSLDEARALGRIQQSREKCGAWLPINLDIPGRGRAFMFAVCKQDPLDCKVSGHGFALLQHPGDLASDQSIGLNALK